MGIVSGARTACLGTSRGNGQQAAAVPALQHAHRPRFTRTAGSKGIAALLLAAICLLASPLPPAQAERGTRLVPNPDLLALNSVIRDRVAALGGTWGVVVAVPGLDQDIVGIGAETPLRTASLYKLVLMVEAYRQQRAGRLDFAETLVMTEDALAIVLPYPSSLEVDEEVAVADAIEAMITISANAPAVLLGQRLGWQQAERTAAQLGLTNTRLSREPTTTATDMRLLLSLIAGKPADSSLLHPEDAAAMRGLLARQRVNDRIPAHLRQPGLVAHKTGDLPGIVNEAAVLAGPDGPIVLVLLAKDAGKRAEVVVAMRDIFILVHAAAEAGLFPAVQLLIPGDAAGDDDGRLPARPSPVAGLRLAPSTTKTSSRDPGGPPVRAADRSARPQSLATSIPRGGWPRWRNDSAGVREPAAVVPAGSRPDREGGTESSVQRRLAAIEQQGGVVGEWREYLGDTSDSYGQPVP